MEKIVIGALMKELKITTRAAWRRWLSKNHDKSDGVWLVFFKKATGKKSLSYDDAVEEALCFGWIDSIIKKRDDESYLRKLTPRKLDSRWSDSNKRRIEKLTQNGLMEKPGLDKVDHAKKTGPWNESSIPNIQLEMPAEFLAALRKNKKAHKFFTSLAPSYQKQFIGWIAVARRADTKRRRIDESIALLNRGEKLGMK